MLNIVLSSDVDARCGGRRVAVLLPPDVLHQLQGRHAVQLGEGTRQRHLLIRLRPATTKFTTTITATTPIQTWTVSF